MTGKGQTSSGGLDAVRKIEMLLDRDEFVVTHDPAEEPLIATIKRAATLREADADYGARSISREKSATSE